MVCRPQRCFKVGSRIFHGQQNVRLFPWKSRMPHYLCWRMRGPGLTGQTGKGERDHGSQAVEGLFSPAFFLSPADGVLNLAYFLLKRSTLPAESTSFCLPVKKGWHLEHISTCISLRVEPVSNSLPQAHRTIAL